MIYLLIFLFTIFIILYCITRSAEDDEVCPKCGSDMPFLGNLSSEDKSYCIYVCKKCKCKKIVECTK